MQSKRVLKPLSAALCSAIWPVMASAQITQDIRVVAYNTQDDVSSPTPTGALPYLETVLEGVGQEKYVGDNILQLPDIIGLEENTSNAATVSPITTALNNYYGANIFNYSGYLATSTGGSGGGPNGLIYNQTTMTLLNSVGVGTPEGSTNGEYRQVVRYEFEPVNGNASQEFYVYVCHAKALDGNASEDMEYKVYQGEEATIIRNNEATLPSGAAVIYMGDWNVDASTDPSMVEMSSAGQGQAFDPLNPTNQSQDWAENSTYKGILTESDTDLRYRDDLQLMTSNVLNDTAGTLNYIPNSFHAFGNNGNTGVFDSTDNPPTNNANGSPQNNNNTAINDIYGNGPLSISTVFNAEQTTNGSDHLPIVGDYSEVIATPTLTWDNLGGSGNGTAWDTLNENWNNGANPNTYYQNGSNVIFNDTNNTNYAVTLNTMVAPASVIVNNSSNSYVISGTGGIAGTGALTKSGSSMLTLDTVNTYTGGTNVSGGSLVVGVSGALPDGVVSVTGGTLQLGTSTGLAPITSLSITGSGVFDVNNNHVILNYGSGADPIASIANWIATGYAGGAWNGTGGIISSAAAANPAYGVGYADSADPGNPANLGSATIEIMYTLLGDANLDGVVNGVDFGILAANFNKGVTGWDQGDFNYAGVVNGVDFGDLAANFNKGDAGNAVGTPAYDDPAILAFAAANGLLADVPEPATLGLCLLASAGLLRRRRRTNRVRAL